MYRDACRDTREQAGRCAICLEHFQEIVLPLSQSESSVPLHDRLNMIQQFIATIDKCKSDARGCSDKFNKLEEKIQNFRNRLPAAPQGFFANIWSKVTDFCSAIGRAISKLLDHFVTLIRQLFSELKSVHMSMGPLRISAHFGEYSRIPEEFEMNPRGGITPEIDDAARRFAEKVSTFGFAWDAVRTSCDMLRMQLILMETTPTTAPDAVFQSQFEKAGLLYGPLVECMRAYALGRSPRF
ncbi:uncharacterized protein B0H18DRAFT_985507 [Fomitopsis serialis]|uniref:uncharacterized protein n=1 Tax=Fomitopsis serialis TaxID=139415 RepID=UPI002007CFA5|nr:uncharacterized protein B0H18DRAFT_985507 [Neoantrodia serialis]KAH9932444.1 hypothetical protein B0H18DRAFT_985507 [Neoantrodia serialis]